MTPVFLDTSFLLALVLSDDEDHERAVKWRQAVKSPLLTTEYVLLEVLDALISGPLRDIGLSVIRLLNSDPVVQIIPASTALLEAGINLFAQRMDKEWGITDCISFAVMQANSASQALTADHDFVQAGFAALLLQTPPDH
ncbi:MAG TPA: PIN domain-containing protein [Tepidisphaeraceae bacterium]|jgi:hypothetical protein|nr:PIN domain-containing protein [Tepidisphaeraceae bacterium]